MSEESSSADGLHDHVFLGAGHEHAERRTWAVIWLCSLMMVLEIAGGLSFGSIALVADGLHMSTHAAALLLSALAYSYARSHANDPRFSFGTGKLGDLAGFTSAIVLAMIALLIAYDAAQRLFAPVPIVFSEAIPIACLGLVVNLASARLLGSNHHHGHSHAHDEAHAHDEGCVIVAGQSELRLIIYEQDVPPRFRLSAACGVLPASATVDTVRGDGAIQVFDLVQRGTFLESCEIIPEPHEFAVTLQIAGYAEGFAARFEEHVHGAAGAHQDNNMRAAAVHVIADAFVSVLVIAGLVLARAFHWRWTDPVAGLVGAVVIASWSWGLVRDTGAILLDMTPDRDLARSLRETIECEGDRITDFHVWRLGPGHLGAILAVRTHMQRTPGYYREKLRRFRSLSHVTVEVEADA